MPKTRASDGGHTAFTDHRIGRPGKSAADGGPRDTLAAWREPEPSLRDRNLALALIADGLENGTPEEAVRGYRQLAPLEGQFGNDDAVEASLGGMLVRAKQYGEALKRFEKAASVRPAYPPYRLNVAMALLGLGREAEAKEQLEKTVALDPLFRPAVEVLAKLYRLDNQAEKAEQLMGGYLKAVGVNKK
jgi:predicted Zn-dependent protease